MDLPTPHSAPQKSKLPLAEIHLLLNYLFSKILRERFYYGLERKKKESEVAQSGPTLSDPMDCSPSGSSIHGIF